MGIVSAVISMIFAGISTYLYKRCSPLLGPTNTTFFYYLSGFVIASIVWVVAREKTPIVRGDLIWPFFTALSLFISIWTFNYSLQTTNVSIASPIRGMSFVVTAFLAVWISSEKLYLKDYLAMALAIFAIIVFSVGERPSVGLDDGAKVSLDFKGVRSNFMLRVLILLISVSVLPLRSNAEVLSISQFGAIAPQSGEFQISGYVVKHYQCTPFPTSGLCAPCMPNNVLLSEKNEVLASYPQKGNYLVVNTPNPESFKLGSLYEITVRVLESSFFNGNYGVRDLELMKKGNEKWR